MRHLSRIVLSAALASTCAAADAADAGEPAEAYDVTIKADGQSEKMVFLFTRDHLAVVMPSSPERVELSDERRTGAATWMSCTRAKDNSFTATLEGMSLHGAFSHGQLSGGTSLPGPLMSFSGSPSPKHYRIVKPLDREELLAQARERASAHRPKEAIALFRQVIESDRFDTQHTGPALVGLVACLQELKDDAKAAAEGRALLERYLSAAPPRDGELTLDAAEEDLLWKPWPGADGKPAPPLVTLAISSISMNRVFNNGVASDSTEINIQASTPPQMQVITDPHATDQGACIRSASAKLADGSEHPPARAWSYTMPGMGMQVQLHFEGLPKGMKTLASVAGKVTVTQEKELSLLHIPLREGAIWDTPDAAWRIAKVANDGARWTLTLVETTKQAGGGTSSGSSSSGGAPNGPLWLSDGHGAKMEPSANSSQSTGGTTTLDLTVPATGAPTELVHRVVTKVSSRELPFSFSAVELP